jgi:hypothetical protein
MFLNVPSFSYIDEMGVSFMFLNFPSFSYIDVMGFSFMFLNFPSFSYIDVMGHSSFYTGKMRKNPSQPSPATCNSRRYFCVSAMKKLSILR